MMTDAGRGVKIKNIFVEPYTPFGVNGELLINKNSINWYFAGIGFAALVIIGISLIDIPASLPVLIMLISLAMPVSFALDETGLGALYPIKKKRAGVNVYTLQSYLNRWYSEDLAKADVGYQTKLIDYLDYLRGGGERSETAETHLNAWYKHAEQIEKRRAEAKDKNIAAMFVNEEQLKAYRRALQDVEKTSD